MSAAAFALGAPDSVAGELTLLLFKNVTNSSELLAVAKRGEMDAALLATDRVRISRLE